MVPEHEPTPDLAPLLGRPVIKRQHIANTPWILFLICVFVITIDFGAFLAVAPQTQLFESIICRNLHPDIFENQSSPDNARCKAPDVQGELALLNGWKDTFDGLPGIILALPYGFMADRIGRKKVLLLSLSGIVMQEVAIRIICWYNATVPLRAVWFMSLFQICGGGAQIATSVASTMVTDIFPVEKRANMLYIISAAVLLSEILAAPLSAKLMLWNPWLPYLLSLAFEILGLAAGALLPETLPRLLEDSEDESIHDESNNQPYASERTSWKDTILHAWAQVLSLTAFIWDEPNTIAICIAFLTASVGRPALELMLQYASKRFTWSLAAASLLISFKGIINLIAFLVILPFLSQVLGKYYTPIAKDLRTAQGSAAILALGFSIMAVSGHPAPFIAGVSISALGWGFFPALRSVANSVVSESQVGVMNTTIGLVQGLGSMAASPMLAGAFRRGMELDGFWLGLPYLVGTGLMGVSAFAAFWVKVGR